MISVLDGEWAGIKPVCMIERLVRVVQPGRALVVEIVYVECL
jgi:hypothetical protein